MRFEIIAAFVIGVLLPVLETARRGISHWAINFTTMFEDYLAGALLLVGGWAAYRSKSWGSVFLVLAWAYFSGLMTSSFVGQLEETLRQNVSEPNNLLVVVVKLLLWSVCVVSLVLSLRTAMRRRS
jgi:biotin transporter BioY